MFCVLNVKERNKTFIERLFGKFFVDEYSIKTIPVFKGAPFFMLDVLTNKKEIDWENVIYAVGKCSSRLVLNKNVKMPDDLNVGIFKSPILYNKMMGNTYLQVLENNKNNFHSISVMDRNGEFTDFVKQISKYASSMSICTLNKDKYNNVCEDITDEIGMCPILSDNFENAKIKINFDTLTMTIQQKSNNINISKGDNFIIEPIYEDLLPQGINKYDFYSALYELCGVFSLGESIFDTIVVNNEKKRVQDIHFS